MFTNLENKINYRAALYIRLSKEDEQKNCSYKNESESICNQKAFLLKFIEENSYNLFDIYIDDGYTGTNFDRPGFKRMINDIELGKVNMVVTKDLSRLGRDYIATGEYVEKWFPRHNVRYISLLDGVDTMLDSANNEIAPFKTIINDMYSKDNSKKIRQALRTKQQQGKWVGGCPPFGYMVDPKDKNHLIINNEEAFIVKKIFSLALIGKNKSQIATQLVAENIPTPSMIRKKNRNFKFSKLGYWNTTTIKNILSNVLYTGDMVQNRHSRVSYKVRNIKKNDPSQWIIIPNMHEALISKDNFSEVQRILCINKKLRTNKRKISVLDGLLFCGECKKRMILQKSKDKYWYVICNTYHKNSKSKLCTSHSYSLEKLENIIVGKIREIINSTASMDVSIRKMLENKSGVCNGNHLLELEGIIEMKKKSLAKAYIDKLEQKINEDMYNRISQQLNNQIEVFEAKKELLFKNIESLSDDYDVYINLVKNVFSLQRSSHELIHKLINKIEIHQDKTVDIFLNFSSN